MLSNHDNGGMCSSDGSVLIAIETQAHGPLALIGLSLDTVRTALHNSVHNNPSVSQLICCVKQAVLAPPPLRQLKGAFEWRSGGAVL